MPLWQLVRSRLTRGIWFQQVGIDAVVNDADPLAEGFREGAGLPVGGVDPRIGKLIVHQVVEVFPA